MASQIRYGLPAASTGGSKVGSRTPSGPVRLSTTGAEPLPEPVIAALIGVTAAEMWDIRNRGVIPPGALPRVRAFADLANETEVDAAMDEGEQQ